VCSFSTVSISSQLSFSSRSLHTVSNLHKSKEAAALQPAVSAIPVGIQLSPINNTLSGGPPPSGVSVGEAARESKKDIPPEPETQLGREAPKIRHNAQAATPSPYQITADHVKRVSRLPLLCMRHLVSTL
jgi:hypothetical protein